MQSIGPLAGALKAAATQTVAPAAAAIAQRTQIRMQALSILGPMITSNSSSPSPAAVTQSMMLVSEIVGVLNELSPQIRSMATSLSLQVTAGLLANSTLPFSAAMSGSVLSVLSSASSSSVIAGVGNQTVAEAASVSSATTNTVALLSQGLLIGALPGAPAVTISTSTIVLVAQRWYSCPSLD